VQSQVADEEERGMTFSETNRAVLRELLSCRARPCVVFKVQNVLTDLITAEVKVRSIRRSCPAAPGPVWCSRRSTLGDDDAVH
jgi:hypothetical protein